MQRHRVDQMHAISLPGKPERISAAGAADIKSRSRWRREVRPKNFLRPKTLQLSLVSLQAQALGALPVVSFDFSQNQTQTNLRTILETMLAWMRRVLLYVFI